MLTTFKDFLGSKDVKWWDGLTRTFTRRTSTGGDLTQNKMGEYVDVLEVYGNGTDYSATAINLAINMISSNTATLRLKPGTWTIDAAVTVPANLTLECPHGATLVKSGSGTLTINGPFSAGLYQVFSGFSAGNVVFGARTPHIQAEWFGEVGDGVTDNTSARAVLFGSAIASSGRKVVYGPGTFIGNYSTNIAQNPWSLVIEGQSPTGTQIKGKANANADVFGINVGQTDANIWPSYWIFRNLLIDGNSANNTSGSALNLYQVNLFRLDNVILQNGAEWNLKVVDSIGVTSTGATPIWGNTVDATKGSGSIYIEDSTDIDLGNVALQSFTQTVQWPLKLVKTTGMSDPSVIMVHGLYLEGNKNGININDATSGSDATGMSIQIHPTELIGLSASGGTLFDITGAINTNVLVVGGNAYNSWDANWVKTTGTPTVQFNNVNGISNTFNYQHDLVGYIATQNQPELQNYIPNGDFEFWDTTDPTIPWDASGSITFAIGSGGTYAKDGTNYKSGAASWKYDNSGASAASLTTYTFRPHERRQVIGKFLNGTVWVKGDAAAASDLYITVTAASLSGGVQTYTSDSNNGTAWERLRVVAYIPTDTTAITITSRVYNPRIASVDQFMASANYAGPYTPKDNGLYGSITWNPGAINTGAGNAVTGISVPGAAIRDSVEVYPPYDMLGLSSDGYVSGADAVVVTVENLSGTNRTLGSGVWSVRVNKP